MRCGILHLALALWYILHMKSAESGSLRRSEWAAAAPAVLSSGIPMAGSACQLCTVDFVFNVDSVENDVMVVVWTDDSGDPDLYLSFDHQATLSNHMWSSCELSRLTGPDITIG